ncbi:MAG TPA: HAMP domain-containing sensor histidine kinase [Steroidobacteraceae bacterium]|nr:HAMP domain-containing sensor histidine kinase [Steroidobacteraceae bacterium]
MSGFIARWWSSIGFRQALIYGALVVFTMTVLLVLFYLQTVGVWQRRIDSQIDATTQRLVDYYQIRGSAALAGHINSLLGDGIDSDTEVYTLVAADGHMAAGNLAVAGDITAPTRSILERQVLRAGRPSQSRLRVTRLGDGGILIVGRDMKDQHELKQVIRGAIVSGAAVTLLMAVAGAVLFRRQLERRISTIRETAARIERGDLAQRVPIAGQQDEFARLSHDINAMLDRIHALMEGVRHVSNTIAHNIRTPLSRILARLYTAQNAANPAVALPAAVGFAISEIQDLNVVFDKLLRIAEVESGARRQTFTAVSLDAIAVNALELYDAVAEAKGLTFTHTLDAGPATSGDGDLLANAVANLIDNAIKYTPAGGAIHVDTRREGAAVTLTVRDNGRGIPADERARVGTRFYRLDRAVPGWGLGLASVRAIARLHGGTLQLEDAGPGLVARLVLPVSERT